MTTNYFYFRKCTVTTPCYWWRISSREEAMGEKGKADTRPMGQEGEQT